MALSRLVTFTTILSILVVIEGGEKNKPGAITLCGNHFVEAWMECCEMGYAACNSHVPSSEGEGVEALLKRSYPLIPSKVAKTFFGTMTKRGWGGGDNSQGNSNPQEECCNEGCSYTEIAEYNCHS